MKDGGNISANASHSNSQRVVDKPRKWKVHMWGGGFHRVPLDFSFPQGTALIAWQHYCVGNEDPEKGYPPLRDLVPSDMPTSNLRERFCDFKLVMRWIEDMVEETSVGLIVNPTAEEAVAMFMAVEECQLFDLPVCTRRGRTRRVGQMNAEKGMRTFSIDHTKLPPSRTFTWRIMRYDIFLHWIYNCMCTITYICYSYRSDESEPPHSRRRCIRSRAQADPSHACAHTVSTSHMY